MPFKFFCIPARDDGTVETEVNTFLMSHRVLAVDRRWVDQGADSYWALCVDYVGSTQGTSDRSRGPKGRTKDYREILSAEDFTVFAKLRELRKEIAQAEAVPVYTLFTNEQLAQMVQAKAQTRSDLEQIDGVGDLSTARC